MVLCPLCLRDSAVTALPLRHPENGILQSPLNSQSLPVGRLRVLLLRQASSRFPESIQGMYAIVYYYVEKNPYVKSFLAFDTLI